MEMYGQIDLTALGEVVRAHPDAVKTVQTRDGRQHKYLNINLSEMRQPSQYGHTHYIKAGIPKAQQRQDIRYYLCDLKPSNYSQPQAQQPMQYNTPAAPPAEPQPQPDGDLPF